MKGPVTLFPDDVHVFFVKDIKDPLFVTRVEGLVSLKRTFERYKHLGGLPTNLPHAIPYTNIPGPPGMVLDADVPEWEAKFRGYDEEEQEEEDEEEDVAEEVHEEEELNFGLEQAYASAGKRPRECEQTCAKDFEREDVARFMQFLNDNRSKMLDALFPDKK